MSKLKSADLDTSTVPLSNYHARVIEALQDLGAEAFEKLGDENFNLAQIEDAEPFIIANAMHELAHSVRVLTQVVKHAGIDVEQAIYSLNSSDAQDEDEDDACDEEGCEQCATEGNDKIEDEIP